MQGKVIFFFRSIPTWNIPGFCDLFFYDSVSDDSTAGFLYTGNTMLASTEVD